MDKGKGLIIVNSSGGLVYSSIKEIDQNEMLVLGTTIYSLVEMLEQTISVGGYKRAIEYGNHRMVIFKTLTKYLFIFLWDDDTTPPFNSIYVHFCDTILQDYDYCLGMPVRSDRFTPEQYF